MDISRKQFTNIEPGKEFGKGPMNMFVSVPEYPPASFKGVVRSNFDTLYSIAWLDLTKEPMVISAPDTAGRYYLLPMLDMWTDVFASPGWRTTGTQAGNFLVTPPGWNGDGSGRDRAHQRADALCVDHRPHQDRWPAGLRRGAQDPGRLQGHAAVRMGQGPEAGRGEDRSDSRHEDAAEDQVDTMPAGKYFAYAAELLKLNPPHLTDEPILARMRRIGIEAGRSFDIEKIPAVVRDALNEAPEAAHKLMEWKLPTLARVANGWSMNTDTMGVYGNYYLKRAIVTQLGLGANLAEDAIYPLNLGDADGKPLDGANRYVLRFEKAATPPVDAFWSITLYDPEGFQVANVLNRFAVSSWMPFRQNADGSLDLYFQNESPGQRQRGELAAGAEGPVQSNDAPLCAENRGPHRPLEPACGRQIDGASGGSAVVEVNGGRLHRRS